MSTILRWLSPLLFRLLRHFGPRLTGIDQARLREMRNRVLGALAFAVVGLFVFGAGLLTAIIDGAVQFEQHGAVEFNAVMMTAAGLGALGAAGLVIARVRWPSFDEFRAVTRRADVKGVAKPPRRPEYAH